MKTVIVAAVGLLDGQGNILLTSRRPDGYMPHVLEIPGGKVEPDEAPEVAACREMEEELGVRLQPEDLQIQTSLINRFKDIERCAVVLIFTAEKWQGEIEPQEGQQLHWTPVNKLVEIIPDFIPGNAGMLTRLQTLLSV